MRICVDCGSEYADDIEFCDLCGGELRRRRISEAIIDLMNGTDPSKNNCPRCGTSIPLCRGECACTSCGAQIAWVIDEGGRSVLVVSDNQR